MKIILKLEKKIIIQDKHLRQQSINSSAVSRPLPAVFKIKKAGEKK